MYDNIETMYAIVHLFNCLLFFMLICVHYCIDVVAVVVVEMHSIQFNVGPIAAAGEWRH